MRAEAGLFSNSPSIANSLEFLNMVRRRAYLIDPNTPNQTTPEISENDLTSLNVDPLVHNVTGPLDGNRSQRQTLKNTPGLQIDVTVTEAGSPDLALAAVLRERRKEFCFEGHRRDDLIRNGILEEIVTKIGVETPSVYSAVPGHYVLDNGNLPVFIDNANQVPPNLPGDNFNSFNYRFPIPLSQINLNPSLKQNTGY